VQNFLKIADAVREASQTAKMKQKEVGRSYKEDGSVVTEVDIQTDRFLSKVISDEFPEANVVSEEFPSDFVAGRELTFAVDPIDGTDSYSQGMPAWCVAVGILDSTLEPIGGIIAAPRWGADTEKGIFISDLPGEELYTEGIPKLPRGNIIPEGSQLMIGSKVHRRYDFSTYPGKIRNFGSTVLHAISPLVHSMVEGALIPRCYIWDIAAAHSIIRRFGLDLEYLNGSPIRYETMVHRQLSEHYIICGSTKSIENIKNHIDSP